MDRSGVPLFSDWIGPNGMAGLTGTSLRFFLGLSSSALSFLLFSGAKLWATKNDWIVSDKKEVTTFLF